MAAIQYGKFLAAIQSILANHPDILAKSATVECGRPPNIPLSMYPHIAIYERGRQATYGQTIAAGTRMRYNLTWEVWVSCFDGNSYFDAVSQRDEILGMIEVIMMQNRDLSGTLGAKCLNLGGGDLQSGPMENGFLAQGSLGLFAEVQATV